jgi:hypothetical protein
VVDEELEARRARERDVEVDAVRMERDLGPRDLAPVDAHREHERIAPAGRARALDRRRAAAEAPRLAGDRQQELGRTLLPGRKRMYGASWSFSNGG